jgi:hypothetical protein
MSEQPEVPGRKFVAASKRGGVPASLYAMMPDAEHTHTVDVSCIWKERIASVCVAIAVNVDGPDGRLYCVPTKPTLLPMEAYNVSL